MRIGHIELGVADPVASQAWYTDLLGLELVANQGDRFIWLRADPIEVLLRPGPGPGPDRDRAGTNLVLYSDDVAADAARLEARGVRLEGRGACRWFHDPDGHWWQLVDPTADHSDDEGSASGGAS